MIVVAPASRAPGDRGVADAAAADDRDAVAAADVAGVDAPRRGRPSRRSRAGRRPSAGAAGSTLVHWPAATSVFSAKAPMPSAGDSSVPSASVIFWVALWVAKQYQGLPRRQARHWPHTARQLRTTKSPGATSVTPVADGLDHAGRLVAEQEREVVVDAALAVVQVGVADAAGLHLHQRLARPRVGDEDRLERDRRALAPRHHSLHLVRHLRAPSGSVGSGGSRRASGQYCRPPGPAARWTGGRVPERRRNRREHGSPRGVPGQGWSLSRLFGTSGWRGGQPPSRIPQGEP